MPAAARLRYLEALPSGTDRPRGTLVLVHAFPLNARMWEPQLAIANQGWRVVAPQLRGVDGDQNPPASSVDEYAGEVIDLMDALDIHEAVIGGLSMGGYVTLAMFRHAPRYFLGMILADTRPQADTPEGVEGRKRMLRLVHEGIAVARSLLLSVPAPDRAARSALFSNSTESIAGAIHALMTRRFDAAAVDHPLPDAYRGGRPGYPHAAPAQRGHAERHRWLDVGDGARRGTPRERRAAGRL